MSDRFHIDPSQIPPGMSALWVTDSVLEMPMAIIVQGLRKMAGPR